MAYAAKGLALYQSLDRHSVDPWTLHVLPMDRKTYDFLCFMKLSGYGNMVLLDPDEVMNGQFSNSVRGRDIAYTCFSATPWLMRVVAGWNLLEEITYLDSDLYFFSDPMKIHRQINFDKDVAIVPHRFLKHDVERLRPSGQFNVSWVTIRTDGGTGRRILNQWTEQVLAKCDRESCGDQKYLDTWPDQLHKRLHILEDHGIGVAPWNADRYKFVPGPGIFNTDLPSQDRPEPVVFYHFHELKRRGPNDYYLTGYKLPDACVDLIYKPYLEQLEGFEKIIEEYQRSRPCLKFTT